MVKKIYREQKEKLPPLYERLTLDNLMRLGYSDVSELCEYLYHEPAKLQTGVGYSRYCCSKNDESRISRKKCPFVVWQPPHRFTEQATDKNIRNTQNRAYLFCYNGIKDCNSEDPKILEDIENLKECLLQIPLKEFEYVEQDNGLIEVYRIRGSIIPTMIDKAKSAGCILTAKPWGKGHL